MLILLLYSPQRNEREHLRHGAPCRRQQGQPQRHGGRGRWGPLLRPRHHWVSLHLLVAVLASALQGQEVAGAPLSDAGLRDRLHPGRGAGLHLAGESAVVKVEKSFDWKQGRVSSSTGSSICSILTRFLLFPRLDFLTACNSQQI